MPQSVPGLRAADEVAAAAVKSAHDRLRRRGEIGLEREKGRGAGIRDRVRPAPVLDDVDTRVSGWLLIEPHLAVNHRPALEADHAAAPTVDRKSTRLNSSHLGISYAVFCLKKKNK